MPYNESRSLTVHGENSNDLQEDSCLSCGVSTDF